MGMVIATMAVDIHLLRSLADVEQSNSLKGERKYVSLLNIYCEYAGDRKREVSRSV